MLRLTAATATILTALSGPVLAQDYPVTFEHKFGTSVIEDAPERVASLDFAGADDLLALGIQPVTIRHWYGDYPRSVWPWAEPLLEETPTILRGQIDFEAVAAAEPDVIVALWSGITAEEYERLSLIAPVVAVPEGVGDYALPWDERARLTGRAVGREAEAEARIETVEAQLQAAGAAHPEWSGKTAAVAYLWNGELGAYTSNDVRPQLLADLGFETPQALDDLIVGNEFAVTFSPEDLSPIDTDLLVWLPQEGDRQPVLDLPARAFLGAVERGSEIFLDEELTGAFSHASLLSIPYAVERLVPMIEGALDGDAAATSGAD
ncbi:cobalamin/Fe3+-siderophores transport systems, secreted component [Oceanicola granulosus HTCC2516]|uniref:Cobalamin/Fe3+-siderophores transport systems, secreted component n=1 Tax=Oceanicola granulosus (strain ATCC BAA-861 / DSM 15982 / KCTC 12143 / HTCC2516) TaxID=314256 RepID=Q2CF58_OCEGH|nr:ABC transporter substrate-binding protein [Oceanicola granulosus]EAR51269.1 cobalamin/Fe3+-siderophores transport systems, secreted component [Oceanicola granulosus HTCC2516]